MRAFLSLSQQSRPLREQLGEAGQLIDGSSFHCLLWYELSLTLLHIVLSHRVSEIGTALGRAGLRLESLEVNTHQLDMRIALAEHIKEKVDKLHRVCDFSDAAHSDVGDMSHSLSQLWSVVKASPGVDRSAQPKSLTDRYWLCLAF